MNKNQKALTFLALILFGAIAIFVGADIQNTYRWTQEFFEKIRVPLFVLVVFYTGIFFMLNHKEKTK